MTAAYRFRGLGWFASCVGMVLGFYLVSIQVAAERNKLDALNGRIRTAERDVRALETEFDTRANMQQLERWNGDILALSAPVAAQFVRGEAQLAGVRFDAVVPAPGGEVKTAALVVPAAAPDQVVAPVAIAAAPVVAQPKAAAQVAAVARPAPAAHAVARAPSTVVASVSTPAVRRVVERPASARLQRVAMLDGDLLSDLGARARAEAGRP